MRRIDRVIGEARTLRAVRAARARSPDLLPPTRLSPVEIWSADCEVASRILDDLAERPLPDGSVAPRPDGTVDGRRGAPLAVYDSAELAPFVAAVKDAILEVVERMDPTRVLMASMEPRVLALCGVDPADPAYAGSNPARARSAAVQDACVLAWEMTLFEAVLGVHAGNDERRPFRSGLDLSGLTIDGGRIRLGGRLKAQAAERRRLALRSPEEKERDREARADARRRDGGRRSLSEGPVLSPAVPEPASVDASMSTPPVEAVGAQP